MHSRLLSVAVQARKIRSVSGPCPSSDLSSFPSDRLNPALGDCPAERDETVRSAVMWFLPANWRDRLVGLRKVAALDGRRTRGLANLTAQALNAQLVPSKCRGMAGTSVTMYVISWTSFVIMSR